MPKIIHCADIHLDAPFSLNTSDEAEKRRNELRSTFSSLVLYAKNNGTEIFLIAGDLFDDAYVTKDTVEMLKREIASFPECRFFISPGNHDFYSERSVYRMINWPENLHIFSQNKLERVYIPDLNTAVYGYAFTESSLRESPIAFYTELDKSCINILVGHGDVDNPLSVYCPILSKDIENCGFDYVALGHIHKASGILKSGNSFYAYSGCLEGRGFDETGYKGAIAGEVSKGSVSLKGVRFSVKRYEKTQVDLTGIAENTVAYKKISDHCKDFGSDTNLRITLTGAVSCELDLSYEKIREELPKPCFLEIDNATSPILDYERLMSDPTLKGMFFRKLEPYLKSDDPEERKKAVLALKYGLKALINN